jgi:hypothetical protein
VLPPENCRYRHGEAVQEAVLQILVSKANFIPASPFLQLGEEVPPDLPRYRYGRLGLTGNCKVGYMLQLFPACNMGKDEPVEPWRGRGLVRLPRNQTRNVLNKFKKDWTSVRMEGGAQDDFDTHL